MESLTNFILVSLSFLRKSFTFTSPGKDIVPIYNDSSTAGKEKYQS